MYNMDSLTKYTSQRGVEYSFCICTQHQLERCHHCFYDFIEMNQTALDEALKEEKLLCYRIGCMNKGIKTCSICKDAKYCSVECQKLSWTEHKKICNKKERIQINLSCGTAKDVLVDAFPINTRLTIDTGRFDDDNQIKIISFNPGKGPYKDSKIKFDPKLYPNYSIGDLCTYTVRYSKSKELSNITCSDVHDEWTVFTSDEANNTINNSYDNIIDLSSSIKFPEAKRVLIVCGLLLSVPDCFYHKALVAKLLLQNIGNDYINMDDSNNEGNQLLQDKILSGQYSTIIIFGFGSMNGTSVLKQFESNNLPSYLINWVKYGGNLVIQGEMALALVYQNWFHKQWYSSSYCREESKLNKKNLTLLSIPIEKRNLFPSNYYVKAVSLKNVSNEDILYSYEYNKSKECTVAVSSYSKGKIAFIGDVNAEEKTIDIIISIALL